jgi:hypothetical protein
MVAKAWLFSASTLRMGKNDTMPATNVGHFGAHDE